LAPLKNGENGRNLLENAYVRFGAVLAAFVFLTGVIVHETTFRTNLNRDMQELKKDLGGLTQALALENYPKRFHVLDERMRAHENLYNHLDERVANIQTRIGDRWHRTEMRLWVLETEKINRNNGNTWDPAPIDSNETDSSPFQKQR
jgi:hypothetical protein